MAAPWWAWVLLGVVPAIAGTTLVVVGLQTILQAGVLIGPPYSGCSGAECTVTVIDNAEVALGFELIVVGTVVQGVAVVTLVALWAKRWRSRAQAPTRETRT